MEKQSINTVFEHAGSPASRRPSPTSAASRSRSPRRSSFDGVMEITDAIGGVEVCIGGDGIRDEHTGIDWPAGTAHRLGHRGPAVHPHPPRRRRRQRPGTHLQPAAVHVAAGEEDHERRGAHRSREGAAPREHRRRQHRPERRADNPSAWRSSRSSIKDVPFSDFVFVQYPVFADPDDEDQTVMPDYDAAETIWAALAPGSPCSSPATCQRTAASNSSTPAPGTEAEAPQPRRRRPTPRPPRLRLREPTLDPSISGQTADQETCANGKQN